MSPLSRRELLATFLGGSWLAVAGCRSDRESLPPGRLVGASVQLGHQLRARPAGRRSPTDWRTCGVLIVGAGVAGLSAARRLQQSGLDDFVLVELEPVPGGTARSGASPIVGYPWGAHYVPAPTREFPELVELFDELGVLEGTDARGDPIVAAQFCCRDPQERVFYKGTWYEGLYLRAGATADDLAQFKRFREAIDHWVRRRDGQGRRAFASPMAMGSDDAELRQLDRLSMAQWLDQQRFTSPRLRWLVDYACRDDYGMHADQTSAWAGLFYFAARKVAPGLPSRPFVTWPEGNGRIVRHLYAPIRHQVDLGWAACHVEPIQRDGTRWVEVHAISAAGQIRGYRARHVILAVPQFLAPYLIPDYRRHPPPHVAEFQYGPWAVANLMLDSPPTGSGFPLAWDNVLYESPSLGYVCDTYQRGLSHGPAVLTYYYALCDRDADQARARLLEVERDGWAEIALSDLEIAHPGIRRQTRRLDVMRWGHAMIRPRVGFVWSGARTAAARPRGAIHFAHCDLSGLPLFEEAFYHGTRAAREVLHAMKRA